MTTDDQRLKLVLLNAVPPAAAADWGEVERRAAAYRTALLRRRITALGAALILCGLLAVAPATGIVGELRDLVEGSPAPPPVLTAMARNDEFRHEMYARLKEAGDVLHDRYSPVIASQTRGVLALDTAEGPVYLWVAPTQDGRHCWLVQAGQDKTTGRPYGAGSCDGDRLATIQPEVFWTAERPSVKIVHVRLGDPAVTRVRVEVEAAHNLELPVADGHALGTIPKDARVDAVVAFDKAGNEVAHSTLSSG